jgi:hypothetical protein
MAELILWLIRTSDECLPPRVASMPVLAQLELRSPVIKQPWRGECGRRSGDGAVAHGYIQRAARWRCDQIPTKQNV